MTEREELMYLVDLCVAAGQWQRGEGDPDGLTLEIRDRIDKLLRVPQDRLVGPDDPDGVNPRERRIKIKMPDGTWKRLPESQLEKVPCKCSHTGFKWVLKEDKAKQIDEMWSEHNAQLKDAAYDE